MSDIEFIKFLGKMIFKIYGGGILEDYDWKIIKTEMISRGMDINDEGIFDD